MDLFNVTGIISFGGLHQGVMRSAGHFQGSEIRVYGEEKRTVDKRCQNMPGGGA